jgi:small subunit ribosomal protein S3
MGQKIHPYGLRLGIVTDWKSRWYSEKDYAKQVNEDSRIRRYLRGELKRGAISRIDIERIGDKKVQIDIHTARPGVVIGRAGSEADRLRRGLEKLSGRLVKFNVIEVQHPELDATLLARSVADQLEGRVSFRRAMKRAVSTALKAGAEGVRVQASGRLGNADMGRREWYLEGRVPLHTLRADVDFGQATAATTVGAIGVKVWVYKGDFIPSLVTSRAKIAAEAKLAAGPAQRRRPARSRAEAGAGGGGRRLIEAGGGKRLVEAGGGKRKEGGKPLIEAGGGRKLTTADAKGEFEEARDEAEEVLEATTAVAQSEAAATAPDSLDAAGSVAASAAAPTESLEPVTEVEPGAQADPESPDGAPEPTAEIEAAAEPVEAAPAPAAAESGDGAEADDSDKPGADEANPEVGAS